MNLEEYPAKSLVLDAAGIPTPRGIICSSPEEAAQAAAKIGPCVVKAQVPVGKRGKAGGIRAARSPDEARKVAAAILGMEIGGYEVRQVLVEEQASIKQEFYAAVLQDFAAKRPLILFSAQGGMDVEEIAAKDSGVIRRLLVDIDSEPSVTEIEGLVGGLDLAGAKPQIANVLRKLYRAYRQRDAELIEINPLGVLADGRVVALDCKCVVDDSSAFRQTELAAAAASEAMTPLERKASQAGLKFIQLEGNVGVLANGAGLTMTTMDVIRHFGGRPANFLEIGGEAYTKAEIALDLVLSNPGVKSLVVNFCGAYARTDVMAEGVVKAWHKLKPTVPVYFSIHGTGEEAAVKLVQEELGIEPYEFMEDAIRKAVEAAR